MPTMRPATRWKARVWKLPILHSKLCGWLRTSGSSNDPNTAAEPVSIKMRGILGVEPLSAIYRLALVAIACRRGRAAGGCLGAETKGLGGGSFGTVFLMKIKRK